VITTAHEGLPMPDNRVHDVSAMTDSELERAAAA
jgi:hypothetical protein